MRRLVADSCNIMLTSFLGHKRYNIDWTETGTRYDDKIIMFLLNSCISCHLENIITCKLLESTVLKLTLCHSQCYTEPPLHKFQIDFVISLEFLKENFTILYPMKKKLFRTMQDCTRNFILTSFRKTCDVTQKFTKPHLRNCFC